MQIDPFTVVFSGLLIRTILAVLFLVFWLSDRRSPWFAWWSATFFLGNLSALFFLNAGFTADYMSIGVGTALLMTAFCCAWQGARRFEGRRPLWLAVFGVPAFWLAICLVPAFLETALYRVLLSSILLAWLVGATAFEFWRGRAEALPSRWPIVVLFAILAAAFAARIPLANFAPFPIGALQFEDNWVAAFSLILILHTVALAVLIVAISRERLELEQRTAADTDALTGVGNRRALTAKGRRLLSRHARNGDELCLLFLDIDDFKRLNDRLGHSGGDEVLQLFVEIVQDNIRPGDFFFRIGGEEFCCLLPQTSAPQARVVGERIRRRMESATLKVGGAAVQATVSLGVASTQAAGYDLDALLSAADGAVYSAKRQGRNRVEVAARSA